MSLSYPRSYGGLKLVKLVATGVLVVGGASGLLLNRGAADTRIRALREDPTLQSRSDSLPSLEAEPVMAGGGDHRVLFSLRSVQTDVPPDPFQPVAMRNPIPRSPLVSEALRVEAVPQTAAPAAVQPAPVATPAAPVVSAKDIELTGVVQGDPPVAVVQYEGQSLFLKIGDQVADSWRLVEVKERSAIFQMGARRVEVPIKGGSSE